MRCVGATRNSAAVPATVSDELRAGRHWEIREGGARRRSASQETCRLCRAVRSPGGCPGQEHGRLTVDDRFSAQIPNAFPAADGACFRTTIVVCSSCRDENGSDAHPRAGAILAANTRNAARDTAIRVRQVECLGNCKRRLSAALLRDGCWSYVFGDLTTASGPDLVAGAELFATSTDGLIPWRGRPDSLKRGLVSRIPPLESLKELE